MTLSFRILALLGFLVTAASMGLMLYLQYVEGLEPCPMCIFQRVAMIGAGAVFLVAGLHAPAGWLGQQIYAVLAALVSAGGAGIAARHVWLQSLPPDEVPACGPALDYLMEFMPLTEVVTTILRGDGSCAEISAQFLGLTIPGWALVGFVALALFSLGMPWVARHFERRG